MPWQASAQRRYCAVSFVPINPNPKLTYLLPIPFDLRVADPSQSRLKKFFKVCYKRHCYICLFSLCFYGFSELTSKHDILKPILTLLLTSKLSFLKQIRVCGLVATIATRWTSRSDLSLFKIYPLMQNRGCSFASPKTTFYLYFLYSGHGRHNNNDVYSLSHPR